MYKTIIADDELDARSRIINIIESLNFPIEIIGKYDNGLDVKNAILNDTPDILITDIKMPYVDGISLAKYINEKHLPTKVIIITGYDIIDYVKNALEYGAISFIAKPFTKQDLFDALNKVIKMIDEEFSLNNTIAKLKLFHEQNLKIIKENDLSRLVTLKNIDARTIDRLNRDNILLKDKNIGIAVIDYDQNSNDFYLDQYEAIRFKIDEILSNSKEDDLIFEPFSHNNRIVILFYSNVQLKRSKMENILNQIIINMNRIFNVNFTIGISSFSNKGINTNFRHLYTRARKALDYRSVIGGNKTIFFDDILDEEYKFLNLDENEYKQLIFLLNFENLDEVNKKIDSLFNKISNSDYKFSSYYIALNILNSIIKSCNSLSKLYENYLPHNEIIQNFLTLKTPNEMLLFCKIVAEEVIKVNQLLKKNSIEKYYHTIIRYIEENYTDPDISLDKLSEGISLSVSYISSLLKNHDTSFVKYLTTLRIEHAKKLLSNQDNKIIEIAETVGYLDPYYFSHCFKKTTGLSPREYRQNEIKK